MAKMRRRRGPGPADGRRDLELTVAGYKAVRNETKLRVAPLTVIAGTNSSGKSSFVQPFLMMKQSLDSAFDPGALLLHGPNVRITDRSQVLSRGVSRRDSVESFTVGMREGSVMRSLTYGPGESEMEILSDVASTSQDEPLALTPVLSKDEEAALRERFHDEAQSYADVLGDRDDDDENSAPVPWALRVDRNRCFLDLMISIDRAIRPISLSLSEDITDDRHWIHLLRGIIHVPGLRGNPERAYSRSAVGATYPGTFDTYVASLVDQWTQTGDARLGKLSTQLRALGLTWKLEAKRLNDASIELRVGRTPGPLQGGANDTVSVADVGFGVSQTLPVLIALLTAKPAQIVYIEQPEIHLHPRAQLALADILVEAAARGVRVIAETHSSLVIRGIQTAVAEGRLAPEELSLNWFSRDKRGDQIVTVAKIDDAGRFGEWPVDFDDVTSEADWAYLDAVQARN